MAVYCQIMDLDLTDDQLALRMTVSGLFEKESSTVAVRAAEPLGFDARLWAKVTDMGLTTITVPEAQGGGGCGFVDLAIAVEEAGRSLAPVPLIEAAAANHLLASLADSGDDAARVALGRAVSGESLVTLALHPSVGDVAASVPAGAVADAVVVLQGDELVLVRRPDIGPTTPGTTHTNLGALPIADCRIDHGERIVIARGRRALEAHRASVAHWELLTAVALVGLGARALDIGREYVMERRAFGVLIGSFQTIQHRLADNATALDGACLLAHEAAWAQDVGRADAAELATMSFLFAGETAFKTAADSLQFHGGYGYTLECDIQLFLRRAKAWVLVVGDPKRRYAQLAHRLYQDGER
jgi:alkylation response protein AidB-like acyl-CoA dehydrogenase